VGGHGVSRQAHVKIEVRDRLKPPSAIEVASDRQGRRLVGSGGPRGAQAETILDGNTEPGHQRPQVQGEALLARNKGVPVMVVLDVPHLHIIRRSYIVVWAQDQARSFALEKLANGLDLLRGRDLTSHRVV